eukprot:197923-Prorocentrum_minimum.AAC.1
MKQRHGGVLPSDFYFLQLVNSAMPFAIELPGKLAEHGGWPLEKLAELGAWANEEYKRHFVTGEARQEQFSKNVQQKVMVS